MGTLPMIFSVRISADKFTEIQNEIKDFCNSISEEQKEADARFQKEQEWCRVQIKAAEELVAKRKKNDLSTKEMKANEDYAKFMIALEKENAELTKLIAGLEKENKALTAQLEKNSR